MTTAEFQTVFKTNATVPAGDTPAGVVNHYVTTRESTLRQARDLGIGEAGAHEVRSKLAKAFVRRWMMLCYPAIDLSFTTSPWRLLVERNEDDNATVSEFTAGPVKNDPVLSCLTSVQRFFRTSVPVKDFAFGTPEFRTPRVPAGSLSSGRRGKHSYRHMEIHVSAAVPEGITSDHVQRSRDALAHYAAGRAAMYAKGIDLARELNSPAESYGVRQSTKRSGRITVYWAPLPHALSVTLEPPRPKGDPAIVYTVADESFLLDFFDTPNEAPIEHLIREFTEGRLPAPR